MVAATRARATVVADDLTYPTSIAFDEDGRLLVAEAGLPFAGARRGGRVWRLDDGGGRTLVLDDLEPPVSGLLAVDGALIVSEGDAPGRITRHERGERRVLVDGLPGPGNYHINMAVLGPDRRLYFSQGAMTNSGVVGLDGIDIAWLRRFAHAHDVPGLDITLTGENVETSDPRAGDGVRTRTGAFVPFGTETAASQRIAAQLPCTAAVMRCDLDGGNLELVAWGLRNAWALGFLPDGTLLAIDQGADDRGSRPIGDAPDLLHAVRRGAWYGWPDFIGGVPVTDDAFRPRRGPPPRFLLADHDRLPPPERPIARFPVHAGAVKFAVAPPGALVPAGRLVVALFGDECPMTGPAGPRTDRRLVEVDPATGTITPLVSAPFHRPIAVAFHPTTRVLHALDFGHFEIRADRSLDAEPRTGAVWTVA